MDLLKYEGTRRPEIQSLIDRAGFLSDEDIENAQVPLPWFRLALRDLRAKIREAEWASQIDQLVTDDAVDDPEGEMRQWMGERQFLRMGKTSLEIEPGQLIFLPDEGGIWFDTAFCRDIDPLVDAQSTSRGRVTFKGYKQACRDRLNGVVVDEEPLVARPYGVRFFR